MNTDEPNIGKSTWRLLGSVRFALIIVLLLAGASMLAVAIGAFVVPPGQSEAFYLYHLGAGKARLYAALGFLNPYRSWWFVGLLFLLTLSLFACTVQRFRGTIRRAFGVRFRKTPEEIAALTLHQSFSLPVPLSAAADLLRKTLRSYHLSVSSDGERWALFARRGRLGIFGAHVTHLGIIFLLVGGIFIARFGTRSLVRGKIGDVISAPDRSFKVRIDDLELELNPHGQVKDWFSTLTVLDPDSVLTKRIEVNDPLRYKGIRFYQSDWAQAWDQIRSVTLEIEPRADTDASFEREVSFGQKAALPRIGRTVQVTRFVANFVMSADGRIASRSDQPGNPAIQLEVYEDETRTSERWLFLRFPEFHQGDEDPVYAFRFLDYEPVYITGIEMAKAPGSIFVWIGFGLTSLGIFLAFFIVHRRVWVLLESNGEQATGNGQRATNNGQQTTRVWIGGLADKNKAGFEREFERIVRFMPADP